MLEIDNYIKEARISFEAKVDREKATGWALREYSKINPGSVENFIAKTELRPLSVREGSKYL